MRKAALSAVAPFSLALALASNAFAGDITSFNTLQTASSGTIKQIEILNPKFEFHSAVIQRYGGLEWPIISFTVANESSVTIQQMQLIAVVRTSGRSVPLAAQDLVVAIPGGLQPHERKRFDLDAKLYGDWSNVTKRNVRNSTFILTLEAVEDAQGGRIVK